MSRCAQLASSLAGRASAARPGRTAGNLSGPKAVAAPTRAPSVRDPRPENVPGDFAVDHTCIGELSVCFLSQVLIPGEPMEHIVTSTTECCSQGLTNLASTFFTAP